VRDEQARTIGRHAGAQLDPEQVVFVDESGTTIALTRLDAWGWAPHTPRATGSVPRKHAKNTTLVAALTPDGLQVPWLIEGAIEGALDSVTFAWSITEQLAPTLRPGHVVVRENVRVHQAQSSRQALAARHCQLLFRPPSSPDCTPIEHAFPTRTAILRGRGARTKETRWEALQVAVEAITPTDAIAWFAHAGYALPAPAT
jgi:transposase